MTAALLAGAVAGLGVLLLVLAVAPPRLAPGSALARIQSRRAEQRRRAGGAAQGNASAWRVEFGHRLSRLLSDSGLSLGPGLRGDLAMVGRSVESYLATTVLAALGGLLAPVVLVALAWSAGLGVDPTVPVVFALAGGLVGGLLPFLSVRSRAAEARRDFRHVVGSFLDLVAMSLAGGRGVPEALTSAAELSDGWAMVRLRDALSAARLRGQTPWSALGMLGEEVAVDELRDLAAALALVAEDGAKVRDSLSARANSLRHRELAESEGKAGQDSQSMLVAQLLLAVGFLVFLVYPAVVTVIGTV